jgi:predicted nucleotidyltransferase
MRHESVQQQFAAAVDDLVEQIKEDRSVIAAVLCGSLSHDTVWAKSDVDLVLITLDEKKIEEGGRSLYADGVNVHALLLPRAEFRKAAEGSVRNSFMHSFLAKGRLLYTHDESIEHLFARLRDVGERDVQLQLFRAATHVLPLLYKAHKWFVTRGDLDYTALWILYAAEPLARLEVIGARQLADREVIPQATRLNPALFATIYSNLLNTKKTKKSVQTALDTIDAYLSERAPTLFAPLLDHLREVGETRTCTELEDHFARNFDVGHVTTVCEYLADLGLLGKAAAAVRLTKRSNVDVQELAFFSI